MEETGEIVAIKKVLQDKRFKVRSERAFACGVATFVYGFIVVNCVYWIESRAPDYAAITSREHCAVKTLFLL